MGWNTRGLRGNILEEMINYTNEKYRKGGLALVQKIPTPIKPVQIDSTKRTITLAYFEQKSTVDFIGVVQGVPICFDAKEVATDKLPLQNIHQHQLSFMGDFMKQNGLAFLLVYFTQYQEAYYLPYEFIVSFFDLVEEKKHPKHIKYSEIPKVYQLEVKNGLYIHYLNGINDHLLRITKTNN